MLLSRERGAAKINCTRQHAATVFAAALPTSKRLRARNSQHKRQCNTEAPSLHDTDNKHSRPEVCGNLWSTELGIEGKTRDEMDFITASRASTSVLTRPALLYKPQRQNDSTFGQKSSSGAAAFKQIVSGRHHAGHHS